MTPEDIMDLKNSRKFNPKNISDWLDLIVKSVIVGGIVVSFTVAAIRMLAPEWITLPADVRSLSEEVSNLRLDIDSRSPQVVDFKGNLIVSQTEMKAGEALTMVAVLRRNVSCDTKLTIRFWDHDRNIIADEYTYERFAQKAPVTREFSSFAFTVLLPENLRDGTYSYFPLLEPVGCGVYRPVNAPMSTPFTVTSG
jgi:hypothetical protein